MLKVPEKTGYDAIVLLCQLKKLTLNFERDEMKRETTLNWSVPIKSLVEIKETKNIDDIFLLLDTLSDPSDQLWQSEAWLSSGLPLDIFY